MGRSGRLLAVILILGIWSLYHFIDLVYLRAGVGGPACRTDPECGDPVINHVIIWLVGIVVILFLAWTTRSRRT